MSELSGGHYESSVRHGYSPEVENNLTLARCQLAIIRGVLGIGPEAGFTGQRQVLVDNRSIQVNVTSWHLHHMEVTIAASSAKGESYFVHVHDSTDQERPWQVSEFDSGGLFLGTVPVDDEQQAEVHANTLRTALFNYAEDLGSNTVSIQAKFTR